MTIVDDLKRYSNGSIIRCIYTILLDATFHMILLYRISHMFYHLHMEIISKIIMYVCYVLFSVDIDYRCEIGGGFRIVHGIGIVVGHEVKIGKNVSIYQGVTLGGNNNKRKLIDGVMVGQPIIRDNVILYTDCLVLGPCEIGENSVIAARALVMHDIKPNRYVYSKNEMQEVLL